ncbi:hypothetical protein TrST_g12655 [Triparma strigata]|uniref:phenylalanine--tRNA ligase n=1 Tax=Triparma strigata TaxID=1606541 RepID=A0A9W7BWB1_9STRA|nr:hypothetical protein TrST_g12655 [Triparma strigata]
MKTPRSGSVGSVEGIYPTLSVQRSRLFTALNKTYTDQEFDELCFEFGVELDEITNEREEAEKMGATEAQLKTLSTETVYKIDVPANRYDLLCNEGLSRSLRIFLGQQEAPTYQLVEPASGKREVMTVKASTKGVRPHVVCAILRNITFNQERYESFIDLQDQLHRNLCRMRTLVAIGTHDYDTVEGPFEYHAKTPESIDFVPLTETDRSFTAKDLMEHYETDPSCKHLKPYVPIIKDEPLYPVIYDQKGTVLSLPPIINGRHSRIQLTTTNVFIECTATDLTKANIVLDTVVAMFSEHCAQPFTVEPVDVVYEETGEIQTTPILFSRTETAKVDFVNSLIGIKCDAERMVELCHKMQLGPAELLPDGETLRVTVPCTRSDILHAVDIAEDIGIAYGYNNIVKKVPTTCTVGGEQPLNHFGDLLREEIARAGYIEVLTHGLLSTHDNYTALRKEEDGLAVSLSNPANIEYEVIRTTLLPGLLKVLEHNKSASFSGGFKIFEISDVVLKDLEHVVTESIVGSKNSRRLAAVYAGPTAGFEIIHGLVDRVMCLSEVAPDEAYIKNSIKGDEEKYRVTREGLVYTIAEGSDPMFFQGRAADILMKRDGGEFKKIGSFGVVHPEVLKKFDIGYPASMLEINIEDLM